MNLTTTNQTVSGFSEDQLVLLNKTICKDFSKDEIMLFAHVCSSKQLDPFSNQIYAIKRMGRITFQIGIDGFRSIAERTGEYDGQEGPYWIDEEGQKFEVWLKKERPHACQTKIYRKGISRPFIATVLYSEFKANNNPLWNTMPIHLIGKVSEAAAFRKAFPQQLSNIYEKDENMVELEIEKKEEENDLKLKTSNPKEEMLKQITRLLAVNTNGLSRDDKIAYMQLTCGINVFDDLKKLNEEELDTRITILKAGH